MKKWRVHSKKSIKKSRLALIDVCYQVAWFMQYQVISIGNGTKLREHYKNGKKLGQGQAQ